MFDAAQRRSHAEWLRALTMIPTAAGREGRVVAWIERWVGERPNLKLRRDKAGNLLITRIGGGGTGRLVYITAHLDHPAFVVRRMIDDRRVELEFRGGVHPPYFKDARIRIFDADDVSHRATITRLEEDAKPFKRVTARLGKAIPAEGPGALSPGDVGRWDLARLPRVKDGQLFTHACDDLAAVAAALATLDVLRSRRGTGHVGLLLTRAEEVGFIGAVAACAARTVPKTARLICLENSRSFPDSPIGAGPILRVGDRMSVFHPALTNQIGAVLSEYQREHPKFAWQRKLMPGGACEATAFSAFGYESTCICLPLGNYHNMRDIDGVLAGKRPARVGPEHIALGDYHGMIEMLLVCATRLDSVPAPSMRERLRELLATRRHVLDTP